MEERGLVGLEARASDGSVLGRISGVVADEGSGEVTHVVVEPDEGERLELPISALILDPEADFARFQAAPSDDEPERSASGAPEEVDSEHEGQFVAEPQSPEETQAEEDLAAREDWEDETYTPDSGYPRNDAYVDPETGEEETNPLMEENESLEDDVEDLLADTALEVRSAEDGVVELTGAAATREYLDEAVREIMGLDGVLEVDTTDVDVG
ncbi:MAG: PRC-barrel domain-containing protein [Actinobacteria bacterium]|nr:PRC-barrel domain-containing protein [Actinomycetota bacterium]